MSAEEDYIQQKYQVLNYSNDQFDKNVLFIASGALGISFGFIEKVVPNLDSTTNQCFLIDSWYCFGGVIFISLLAHFISMMAIRWSIRENNNYCTDKYQKVEKAWNYTVRGMNIFMIVGLFTGIVLLIAFVKHNI